MINRSFLVWGVGVVAVMVPFMLFVALGWPGKPDSCVFDSPPSCYCEAFNLDDVKNNEPGVRQPVNTWWNLYAIGTSFVVALMMYLDRRAGGAQNIMKSMNPIADVYIFAVLFLGLGSMWFHASIVQWGGIFDNLSMYVFTAYLVFYTMRRLWASDLAFWLLYPATIITFVVLSALWTWKDKSVVLTLALVVPYLVLEIVIWVRRKEVLMGRLTPRLLWVFALVAMGWATLFWLLSADADKPLCNPDSAFQPHGILWHPLAGVMALLLYFYWREEDAPLATASAAETTWSDGSS